MIPLSLGRWLTRLRSISRHTHRAPALKPEESPFMPPDTQAPIEKIRALPAERIAEVEDFVDFIHLRERDVR